MRIFVAFLICAASALAQPQSAREELQTAYRDSPRWMNAQQRDQQLTALNRFWDTASKNPAPYIEALRAELQDARSPTLLRWDGARRLLFLSDTPEDRKLAVAAIQQGNLLDVGTLPAYSTLRWLSNLHEDIVNPAFKILDYPQFTLPISSRSVWMTTPVMLTLLLPYDPNLWVPKALERLKKERDTDVIAALVLMLWHSQTDAADRALQAFSKDPARSPRARKEITDLFSKAPDFLPDELAMIRASPEAQLRERRNLRVRAMTPEDLELAQRLTLMIRAKRLEVNGPVL